MNKPSQITDRNANKSIKKQWIPPIVEVVGADIIKSGTVFNNFHEGTLAAKGSPNAVTKYFFS